jgi:hypothetical protein
MEAFWKKPMRFYVTRCEEVRGSITVCALDSESTLKLPGKLIPKPLHQTGQ